MKENDEDMSVKVPKGQINYNTVGASAGIAAFLGLNGTSLYNALRKNGALNGNGSGETQGGGSNPSVIVINSDDQYGGHGRGKCCLNTCDQVVTQNEMAYAQMLDAKEAEIARLKSEKYTDNHILETYQATVQQFSKQDDKMGSIIKDMNQGFVEEIKKSAILETKVECLQREIDGKFKCLDQKLGYEIEGVYRDIKSTTQLLRKDIDCCCERTRDAIALEGERRNAGLKELQCWVAATYVPGKLVMPIDNICPEPMKRFNAWDAPHDVQPSQS